MKIKTTITFEHTIPDSEVAEFKAKVLEYIDENCETSIQDISTEVIEKFLGENIPAILEEQYAGYDSNSGVVKDSYFGTISFDYCGEGICDLVQKMAELILVD